MIPTLPPSIIFAIERYKLQIALIYGMVSAMLLLPLVGIAGHVQAAESGGAPYQEIVYPIVNKLPAPSTASVVRSVTALSGSSMWPIHGKVTTEFGVYHEPFQETHTGIDISSARPSGVTPVAVFRDGIVTAVIHSNVSYGNHVVVDHGGGLTSLYGHLANTTVTVGQRVSVGTIIGQEGSTGASTGPHVHFETEVNGTPVSPRRYLTGNP